MNKLGDSRNVSSTPTFADGCNVEKGQENLKNLPPKNKDPVQLSRAQVEFLVDTMLKKNPLEVQKYRSPTKRELIVGFFQGLAIGLCKNKAIPDLIDTVLREKLEKAIHIPSKDTCTKKPSEGGFF
ncbi:unnamed protein product [Cuscuta campestris]|uniref:Uncharacterized protein n=1 Tax=Cuscuta campestris TaxID=132261 RepID=A0A484MAM7_9ASTE|nr:unnamed protein product [Cuscuta campestris]